MNGLRESLEKVPEVLPPRPPLPKAPSLTESDKAIVKRFRHCMVEAELILKESFHSDGFLIGDIITTAEFLFKEGFG